MATQITVSVPKDAEYTAQVRTLCHGIYAGLEGARAEVRPDESCLFEIDAYRSIEIREQPFSAWQLPKAD